MVLLSDVCFTCLGSDTNLKSTLIKNDEEILVLKKLKYCLPEMDVNFRSEISVYVCSNCNSKLECLYTFKQMCLRNNTYLKNYFQTLTSTDEPYKHLSIKLSDIKYHNTLHAVKSDQILATVGSNEELRIEDNGTYIKEEVSENETLCVDDLDKELRNEDTRTCIKEKTVNTETQCNDKSDIEESHELQTEDNGTCIKEEIFNVLDIEESQPLFEEEKYITVKEEFCASEYNVDDEFYHESVKSIKSDPVPNICNSSVDDIAPEDSKNCNSYNSTNSKENNLKGKNRIKKKKFQCAICGKELLSNQALKYHLKSHTGIKDFSCSICEKKFMHKSSLLIHEKNHADIKNFKCVVCKKQFVQKFELFQHEQIHTGIKNYECLICGKRFIQKNNMTQHEKIHKDIRNFECSICKKKFARSIHLLEHEQIHVGIKNFECSICKRKFMYKSNLIRHKKNSKRCKLNK